MTILATLSGAIQHVLIDEAHRLARTTGFTQRTSRLTGEAFAQALVLGSLAHPEPTLEDFAQTAALAGCPVSPQAIDQRFGPTAAGFLEQLLGRAIQQVIAAPPVALELLKRFTHVWIQDSTSVPVSPIFRDRWPGSGNPTGRKEQDKATIKFQVRLDLNTGQLTGPFPEAGTATDRRAGIQHDLLEPGSLRIADLGYFDLSVFERLEKHGVFWLSRWCPGTHLLDDQKRRIDLLRLLQSNRAEVLDRWVYVGAGQQLRSRLIAFRVPPQVRRLRQKRLRTIYRRKGKPLSEERLRLCGWNLYLTNLTAAHASSREIRVLARARWQIELLFKLWKSDGCLEQSRRAKPDRQLCEVWAKMTAMVIQHWILVTACWSKPNRSFRKASKVVRRTVMAWAMHLTERAPLQKSLARVVACLERAARISRRQKRPSTFQLLEKPEKCWQKSLA